MPMTKEDARSIFSLAGFTVHAMWELPNGYWPDAYAELRAANPWWLVRTEIGCIVIGWRKRVINIDWSDTAVRAIVHDGDTTIGADHVHAYSVADAIKYLTVLHASTKD